MKGFLQRISWKKNIWNVRRLVASRFSHRPSEPAYYIVDCQISIVLNRIKPTLLKCKNSFIIIHDGLLTDSAETAKQHSELWIFQLNCRNSFNTLRVGQAFLFVNMKTYLRSHPSRLKDVMVILSLRSVVARKTMLCNTRLLPEKYKDVR